MGKRSMGKRALVTGGGRGAAAAAMVLDRAPRSPRAE